MKKRTMAVLAAGATLAAGAGTGAAVVARVFQIDTGDTVVLKGTALGCSVTGRGGARLITCLKTNGRSGAPGSYGVSIGQTGVLVTRFGSNGKPVVIYAKKHGS